MFRTTMQLDLACRWGTSTACPPFSHAISYKSTSEALQRVTIIEPSVVRQEGLRVRAALRRQEWEC